MTQVLENMIVDGFTAVVQFMCSETRKNVPESSVMMHAQINQVEDYFTRVLQATFHKKDVALRDEEHPLRGAVHAPENPLRGAEEEEEEEDEDPARGAEDDDDDDDDDDDGDGEWQPSGDDAEDDDNELSGELQDDTEAPPAGASGEEEEEEEVDHPARGAVHDQEEEEEEVDHPARGAVHDQEEEEEEEEEEEYSGTGEHSFEDHVGVAMSVSEEADDEGVVRDDVPLRVARTAAERIAFDQACLARQEKQERAKRIRKRTEIATPLGQFDDYDDDDIEQNSKATGTVLTANYMSPVEIKAELEVARDSSIKTFFETTDIGRRLYAHGIQIIAGQTGPGNENVQRFFDTFFTMGTLRCLRNPLPNMQLKCVACDTTKPCAYRVVIHGQGAYLGSHCADVVKALNTLFDTIRAGADEQNLDNMREHLKRIDAAHTSVLDAQCTKNSKKKRRR